jgi:hypothetical protein
MLNLDGNTIAIMTAILDSAIRQLKPDTPEARKALAARLKQAANQGARSIPALTSVADRAVREINAASRRSNGWWGRLQKKVFRGT